MVISVVNDHKRMNTSSVFRISTDTACHLFQISLVVGFREHILNIIIDNADTLFVL